MEDSVNWKAKGSTVREGDGEAAWLNGPRAAGYLKPATGRQWKAAMADFVGPPDVRRRSPLRWVLDVLRALNPLRWL